MRTATLAFLLSLPLAACTGEPVGDGTCTPDPALDAGMAVATVDGAAWSTSATWLWQGESLQVNAAPADGWSFSLVGQSTADGETVKAAADAGSFPITLPLAQDGAWVTVYPTDGDSYHTGNADGGSVTITDLGDNLTACFAFAAGTDGGDTVEFIDGSVLALPFSM